MRKYIDVALANAQFTGNFRDDYPTALIKALLDDVPAADVQEVKRGKWLNDEPMIRTYGRPRACCGRCGGFALYEFVNVGSFAEQLTNYCPHCGARMEVDNE